MKLEFKTLIYSMINNLVISLIKVLGGIYFKLGSLVADGMHTLSDFITDIICFIGAKISKKKPTKYHPFGFGKVEYLTNLFVGILLLLLGIYIFIKGFHQEEVIPPLSVLVLLCIVFGLKLTAIIVMHKIGKRINSDLLITSERESRADLYSTIGVMIITILLQFSKKYPFLIYTDCIGSILISLIVLKTALKIISDNSLSIIGEVEQDPEKIEKVKERLEIYKEIKDYNISLIKYGTYYKLQLILGMDANLSLRKISKLEAKIKTDLLKHRSLKIKYVTIFVTEEKATLSHKKRKK